MRKRTIIGGFLILAALLACAAPTNDPKPKPDTKVQTPKPGPDPSALASAGNNKSAALLHVDWDGYREFQIKWHNSQDPSQSGDIFQKPNLIGKKWGGFFETTVTFDDKKKVGLSISAGPRRGKVEWEGRVHCYIKHNGVIVDEDTRGEGNTICIASNVGK